MIRLMTLTLLAVTGCSSPAPDYFGVPARSIMVDGREYRVFMRPDGAQMRAQVIRTGWAQGRDHLPLIAQMTTAAELVSGCRAQPGSIQGDSGVQNLRLSCPG